MASHSTKLSALSCSDCGPVQIAPAKTRIGFQVRMIFAAVNKLSECGLEAHVVLTRRLRHSRFTRIETMTSKCHVHHFRIESLSELDDEVKSWLREAYQVGTQEHLSRRQSSKGKKAGQATLRRAFLN